MSSSQQKMTGSRNAPTSKKTNPVVGASFLSRIFFSWIYPLVKKGYQKELDSEDLYDITDDNCSERLAEKLQQQWERELDNCRASNRQPSYRCALLRCFKAQFAALAVFTFGEEAARIAQPLLLARMLGYFTPDAELQEVANDAEPFSGENHTSALEAYLYALGLTMTSAITVFMHHPRYFYSNMMGMRMRLASCSLIFRKSLQLPYVDTGKVVNLVTADMARLDYAFMFVHYIWLAPVLAAIMLGIIWTHLGLASIPSFVMVLLMVLLQYIQGRFNASLRYKSAKETDSRMSLIKQIIDGIKVIKLYCWEKLFADRVAAARSKEMRCIGASQRVKFSLAELGSFVFSKLATASCVLAFVLMHGRMPPLAAVLIVMRLLGTVQDSVAFSMSSAVSMWAEMGTTCRRVQEFLMSEEIDAASLEHLLSTQDASVELKSFSGTWYQDPAAAAASGAFDPVVALHDVSVRASAGELLAIVGPVGGGKTSILRALLGELRRTSGERLVKGRIAYAAQEPWIFPASLKENIVFGSPFCVDRYATVLEACGLTRYVASHGDQTLVGERGVKLSGGQKARVGLARVAYSYADVCLLDDPLSAVDVELAKYIFHRCINGLLKDRCRVLVTHQCHLLELANTIVVVDGGKVTASGAYSELVESGVNFARLLDRNGKSATGEPSEQSLADQYVVPITPLAAVVQLAEDASALCNDTEQAVKLTLVRPCSVLSATNAGCASLLGHTSKHASAGNLDGRLLSCDRAALPSSASAVVDATKAVYSGNPIGQPPSKTLTFRADNGANEDCEDSITPERDPLLSTPAAPDNAGCHDKAAVNGMLATDVELKTEASSGKVQHDEPERREQGAVAAGTYWTYFQSGCNACLLAAVALVMALGQVSFMVTDWYISHWAAVEEAYVHTLRSNATLPKFTVNSHKTISTAVPNSTDIVFEAVSDVVKYESLPVFSTILTTTKLTEQDVIQPASSHLMPATQAERIYLYAGLVAALVFISSLRALAFYQVCSNASKKIHNLMFTAVVFTRMRFFNDQPPGRLMNRFSKDTDVLDAQIPSKLFQFLTFALMVIGTVTLASYSNPWVMLLLAPVVVALVFVQRFYVRSSRALKRLEATRRSPMISHLNSMLTGLHTVRAYDVQATVASEFNVHQDRHTEAFYLSQCVSRWLGILLDWMSVLFVSSITFLCIATRDSLGLSADLFGLTVTYTVALMGLFQWTVRLSIDVENLMTSVERLVEYTDLPGETANSSPAAPPRERIGRDGRSGKSPPAGWPTAGRIQAENLCLKYSPDGPEVLRNITFDIEGSEKIGVCGRSGSGKSTLLTVALFRLTEPTGRLVIDGVAVADLDMRELRSKISIITQDPVLFQTTVRHNLDPFGEYSDAALWKALRQVQLASFVGALQSGLDSPLVENGANFSSGQRQLLCLARALIHRNRILVVDEATANVDLQTDAAIQKTLREQFKDCTVLTIAHRLDTIADSDRVMVLDGGGLHEFDSPFALLQQSNSMFRALAEETNVSYERVCAIAKAAQEKREADRQA